VGTGPQPRPRGKAEAEFLLRHRRLEIWADAVHLIIPWGSLVLIFLFGYLGLEQLAGRITLAKIGISILGDLKLPQVLSYLFGAGGVSYGVNEARLRRKKTQEMSSHITNLEKVLDSKRTSSGLTTRGTTRPEDRI
jgi:hypothetical protein